MPVSDSSEDDESQRLDENSDENSDSASSLASHLQGEKRPRRPAQIRAKQWVIYGDITPVLRNNSLSDLLDGHAQDEDQHLQDIKSQMEAALGPAFEFLFGKLSVKVRVYNCPSRCKSIFGLAQLPSTSQGRGHCHSD